MTKPATRPLMTRLVVVDRLPLEGLDVTVEATPEECTALAQTFELPAVHALGGAYHLSGTVQRVRVSGRVTGRVARICVVTLEPFDTDVDEEVDVDFSEAVTTRPGRDEQEPFDLDPPDEIVNGRIDLGALTAEFLALGLDPYPRRPGVAFDHKGDDDAADAPFAALSRLTQGP